MSIVTTLKRETKKKNEDSKVLKIARNTSCDELIDKLITNSKPDYNLPLQVLSTKDIQSLIQKDFEIFEFEVIEAEKETSKRIAKQFAPRKYSEDLTTGDLIGDIREYEDVEVIEVTGNKWSTEKAKVKIKENSIYYSGDKEYVVKNIPKAVKINIKINGNNLTERPIFTIPGVKISEGTKDLAYKNLAIGGSFKGLPEYKSNDYTEDNMYKIIDINYIISICKLLETSFKYIDKDTSFLYSPENSYYGYNYTTRDFLDLLKLDFLVQPKVKLRNEIKHLIAECSIASTFVQTSNYLLEKYAKDGESDYAKAFETKKNIQSRVLEVMQNNRLLENFRYVELDNLTDLTKFHLIENEFVYMKSILGLNRFLTRDGEIRFKRLGKHNTNGLFFPHKKCVCIDIENTNAFMQKVAQLIDFNLGNPLASLEADFRIIAIDYKENLEKEIEEIKTEDSSSQAVKKYNKNKAIYHTPSEIFARALEMYLVKTKGMISSLLPNVDDMTLENGYPKMEGHLMDEIISYFKDLFTIENGVNTTLFQTQTLPIELDTVEATIETIISSIEQLPIDVSSISPTTTSTEVDVIETHYAEIVIRDDNTMVFKFIDDVENEIPTTIKVKKKKIKKNSVGRDAAASQLTLSL